MSISIKNSGRQETYSGSYMCDSSFNQGLEKYLKYFTAAVVAGLIGLGIAEYYAPQKPKPYIETPSVTVHPTLDTLFDLRHK